MMGIDRKSIIKTVYGEPRGQHDASRTASCTTSPTTRYRPDFAKWEFNPTKALALLKKHCTGGPASVSQSNSSTWTCSGYPARVRYTWTASNATRTTQEAIIKQEMKSIGIDVTDAALPANVVFGPTGIPSSNYDLANFAWVTAADPVGVRADWGCGGESNYLNYCNRKATKLLERARTASSTRRSERGLFQQADALMANDIPTIPLYSRPNPLIWKSGVLGMKNNASLLGFAWNVEEWKWKS